MMGRLRLPLHNTFIICRHGQSEANVAGIVVSSPENGCKSYGLTELGRSQAHKTGEEIAEWFQKHETPLPVEIWSSDFKRTRETAEELSRVLLGRDDVHLTPLLRERNFGDYELKPAEHAYDEVWAKDKDDPTQTAHGVESVDSVRDRAVALVMELDSAAANAGGNRKTYILVSHGDTSQILQTQFAGVEARLHRSLPHLDPAGWRVLFESHG